MPAGESVQDAFTDLDIWGFLDQLKESLAKHRSELCAELFSLASKPDINHETTPAHRGMS